MTEIRVDEQVQLTQDIPEMGLHRGEIGRVCSTWFDPATAYEVEFQREMPNCSVRALLMLKQIIGKTSDVCGRIALVGTNEGQPDRPISNYILDGKIKSQPEMMTAVP